MGDENCLLAAFALPKDMDCSFSCSSLNSNVEGEVH